jgi:hypothetical protein
VGGGFPTERVEARNVLTTALNTLAVIDRVTPLPVLDAEDSIARAKVQAEKDKKLAQQTT